MNTLQTLKANVLVNADAEIAKLQKQLTAAKELADKKVAMINSIDEVALNDFLTKNHLSINKMSINQHCNIDLVLNATPQTKYKRYKHDGYTINGSRKNQAKTEQRARTFEADITKALNTHHLVLVNGYCFSMDRYKDQATKDFIISVTIFV